MYGAYLNEEFTKHIDSQSVKTIFEVGARDGKDSIALSTQYPNAEIYSFECNPLVIESCKKTLEPYPRIHFFPFGLGEVVETRSFHPYMIDNPGASSFFKRIDYDRTQTTLHNVKLSTIESICNENNIQTIDILCMDTQGYELNILKGAGDMISQIRYIILEQPKEIPNETYLPKGVYSSYIDAPSAHDIQDFLKQKGFVEIERMFENYIEDNVMYKNTKNGILYT